MLINLLPVFVLFLLLDLLIPAIILFKVIKNITIKPLYTVRIVKRPIGQGNASTSDRDFTSQNIRKSQLVLP
nr:hypothetical protein [Clostridia bacterium]PZN11144.1 MAG: hypothetical protein DIU64_03740 [Caldicoprobacter oshimai]